MADPTSSGQHVLMKDQSKIKKAVRQTTIVINSRDRNYLAYPNSNQFRYTLRRPLTNVLSIELINAIIPAYIFTITAAWGSLIVQEGTVSRTVTLTPGYYTDTELAAELQTQLNAMSGKLNTYTVTLSPRNKQITVTSTNVSPYSFLLYSGQFHDDVDLNTFNINSINCPGRLLGFATNDYTSNAAGTIVAPIPMDLETFLNRLYLYLDTDGKNLSRMERSAGREDCFHIFNMKTGQERYLNLDGNTIHSMYTSSPAPIARVSNITVSLRDEFNRLAYLNYAEVQLILEITHLE